MDDAVPLGTAEQLRPSGQALRFLKDEKLATMVAAGSDDAFATLYRRHHQAIYRYCMSILGREADARDALQSAMVAALSSLRARPIEGELKPWLFRIAHNESISIIRGRAREAPTGAPPPVAVTDDPEAREQVRTLVSDLAALPNRQRGAIVMRELSGLSYAEIATALGTSEAGGKQLVYEARTALHDLRAGHEMSCDLVRERISARDRRLLRGRKIRAHLRGCEPCQDFERAIDHRRAAFAAFAPPLAPLAAAAVLRGVFGGSGSSGGAAGAAGAAGVASGGATLAGSAALKFGAAALLAGAAGVGVYQAGAGFFAASDTPAAAAMSAEDPWAARAPQAERVRDSSAGARSTGGADADAQGRASAGAGADRGPGQPSGEASGGTADGPSQPAAPGGSGAPGGGAGAGDPPPSSGPPAPPSPQPAPPPGGGSGAAPGTPPGHGGTPPGQGGTPPGQAGSDVPPGLINNPGKGPSGP